MSNYFSRPAVSEFELVLSTIPLASVIGFQRPVANTLVVSLRAQDRCKHLSRSVSPLTCPYEVLSRDLNSTAPAHPLAFYVALVTFHTWIESCKIGAG